MLPTDTSKSNLMFGTFSGVCSEGKTLVLGTKYQLACLLNAPASVQPMLLSYVKLNLTLLSVGRWPSYAQWKFQY